MSVSSDPTISDGLRAAVPAGLLSGLPSTIHAVLTKRDPLEATVAAGSILIPREKRTSRLLLAAVPVHVGLSAAWGILLARVLPRKRPILEGTLAGVAIAGLDLAIIGPRYPRISALPISPQVADHVAFGIAVAVALDRQRKRQR